MSGLIPGYRRIPLSRVMSAVCHVMCDYCNFQCERCIAWGKNKEVFGEYVNEELIVMSKKKGKWSVIYGGRKQLENAANY